MFKEKKVKVVIHYQVEKIVMLSTTKRWITMAKNSVRVGLQSS